MTHRPTLFYGFHVDLVYGSEKVYDSIYGFTFGSEKINDSMYCFFNGFKPWEGMGLGRGWKTVNGKKKSFYCVFVIVLLFSDSLFMIF